MKLSTFLFDLHYFILDKFSIICYNYYTREDNIIIISIFLRSPNFYVFVLRRD